MVELEDGVAGVGAGLPGPPGPSGISTLGGAVELGEKPGSELNMPSLRSAKVLRCKVGVSRVSLVTGDVRMCILGTSELAQGIACAWRQPLAWQDAA